MAEDNEILKKKYEFMKNELFDGKVFETGKSFVNTTIREWDATKI